MHSNGQPMELISRPVDRHAAHASGNNGVNSVEGHKVCITCGNEKRKKDFRVYRKSCRTCCYQLGKNTVIAWKNGRQEYVNSQYTAWRKQHPLSRKLSIIRQRGYKVKGLLPILESMYRASPWCEYCLVVLNVDDVGLDHKTPMSRGGSADNPENWAICCKDCNALKSGRTASEFKLFLVEYQERLAGLYRAEPQYKTAESVTVSPEITDISAPALD